MVGNHYAVRPDPCGLRSIVEDVMTDIMFELPEMDTKGKFVVTEGVIRGDHTMFGKLIDKKSA